MGAINNINRWYSESGVDSSEQIAERFASFVVNSLGPRAIKLREC